MQTRNRHYRALFVGIAMLIAAALACNQATVSPTTAPIPPTQAPIAQVTVTPLVPGAPTTGPVPIPPSETPPSGSGPGGCLLSAQFVADVTIPDNTAIAPGAAFVKTWRVKNGGTCTWDTAYQLVFAEGNQMSGPAGVDVNNTPPGSTADISVNLKAPTSPGTHTGKWRLRASNGAIFGGLTVVIVVPATPTPTPVPPTDTPTPVSSGGSGPWNGHWESDCGSSNCGTMDLVQTGNTVTGRYAVDTSTPGTINATASGNRLSGEWSRSGSAGKFDWWMGGSGNRWRGNFGGIYGWCGHRAGDSNPTPCGVGTFDGDWTVVCESCDGAMHVNQDGKDFTGTYVNGTVDGTIDGTQATGTWHTSSSNGPFTWYLINSQQFNGNYGGTFKWCGYRSGSSAPSPCLR